MQRGTHLGGQEEHVVAVVLDTVNAFVSSATEHELSLVGTKGVLSASVDDDEPGRERNLLHCEFKQQQQLPIILPTPDQRSGNTK